LRGLRNILVVAVAAIINSGCQNNAKTTEVITKREVIVDSIFNEAFTPKGDGFTGGDGTYSIKLPDGRDLWIFGDSFIGNVTDDWKRIETTPAYIRNSFVTFENGNVITHQQGDPADFKSMIIPPEVISNDSIDEHDLWYWPGDAFIENGNLNVFASKFSQEDHDDMWAFQFEGTELTELSLPDLKVLRVDKFSDLDSIHFGHAVLETGEYLYIYGLKNRSPYVARTEIGSVREGWQFYAGSGWSEKSTEAVPMIEFWGSEQFSVFELEDKYVMIMQGGDLSRKIYSFVSDTPFGPWTNKKMIYETPLPDNCESCWTYNALAHPQFTEDNMLLISYNTNSMVMQDHYDNALIYRPRFIRVPMELIMD
jgi:hypothetical protein